MDFGKLRINISCKKKTLQILSLSPVIRKIELFNYLNLFKYSDVTNIDLFRNRAVSLMTATKNEIKKKLLEIY